MRTVESSTPTTRAVGRTTAVLWILAGLGACDRTPPPAASIAAAPAATQPTAVPAPSAAMATLQVAVAREAASRAAREQTLRVQRHLVEQERIRQAAQQGDGSERCLAGQKMRRVANGWVQAGEC
jgi:hypothetical protein